MRIANTVHDSIVDGQGLRFTVFTQGCPHRCPGCHNPGTHDPAGGREVSVAALVEELTKNPLMAGLTLSGGEPFAQAADCAALAKAAHGLGLTVWTYTGYLFEHLRDAGRADWTALLQETDVLVDGPFCRTKSLTSCTSGAAETSGSSTWPPAWSGERPSSGRRRTPWPNSPSPNPERRGKGVCV